MTENPVCKAVGVFSVGAEVPLPTWAAIPAVVWPWRPEAAGQLVQRVAVEALRETTPT